MGDFAETMECFLAVEFRPERITKELRATIESVITHRLQLLREIAKEEKWSMKSYDLPAPEHRSRWAANLKLECVCSLVRVSIRGMAAETRDRLDALGPCR